MSRENEQGVVQLPDAGVPADQGLSSLGLIMQLAGSVLAAYASLATFVMLFAMSFASRGRGSETLWLFLILGLCIARSTYQRIAGTELLYGRRTNLDGTPSDPLAGLRRYIVLALGHSALVAVLLKFKFHMPSSLVLGVAGGLAAWPLVLLGIMASGRFSRFKESIPVSEDKGFEGASILMTVLGVCGLLGTGSVLLMLLESGDRALNQGPGVLMMIALVMLVIRSGLHVQAGLSGLRETSVDRSVELANRYANFGVITAFCAGGALMLVAMTSRLDLGGLALVAGVCWMLMSWPMIIRKFYSDRQFADLLAGDQAAVHRRAPDAGLTGLGWLLLGHAVFMASFLIPQLVMGKSGGGGALSELLAMNAVGARSVWWNVSLVAIQAWAGWELVRMGPQHRVVGIVYAVVATVVTIYLCSPVLDQLKSMRSLQMPMMVGPLAIQFVLPISTLILVNRKIAPTARARFKPREAPAPAPTEPA